MLRIRFFLLSLVTAVFVACSTVQPSPPETIYILINTSSPELTELSVTALEMTSETVRSGDRLIIDQATGTQLKNVFSATPSDEMFSVLIDGLTSSPSTDEALLLSLKRASDLARDVKEGETFTAIIISPGSADSTALTRVNQTMQQFKTNATSLHVAGVNPATRIPFSSAFQTVRAITKFSSSTDEFSSQFNSQGH
jgi:hypothetical protein